VKPHYILIFCTAAALSRAVAAEEPTLSASALATAEATLDFCTRADPKSSEHYGQQDKLLLQGMTEGRLAEIRASAAYKEAYASAAEAIGKVAEDEALQACRDSFAPNK
jgi:hypothetical protein